MKDTYIKQRYILRLGFVTMLFLVPLIGGAFLFGCSDNPMGTDMAELRDLPSQPETDFSFDPAEVVEFDPDFDGGGSVETDGGPDDCAVKHWIREKEFDDDRSGTLSLGPSMRLKIGADDIDGDVTITGEVWYKTCDDGTEWVVYEFQPAMNFLNPVELMIKESSIVETADDSGQYFLWFFNPRTSSWELTDVGTVNDDWVHFEVEHFSKYAVGR